MDRNETSTHRVDLQTFKNRHLVALEKDEARHNLILGLLNRAEKNPDCVRLWSFGKGASCALQTPPHHIVLGDLDRNSCAALAKEVKDLDFLGCVGADSNPSLFAEAMARFQINLKLEMPQKIYKLTEAPIFPETTGHGRAVTSSDRELYIDWTIAFEKEAVPHEQTRSRAEVEKLVGSRPAYYWEVEGRPVAMASRVRETKTGSGISLVYTPPEFRKNGYGGAVTAFACQEAFAAGKKMAFLYTDLRNPTSNKIYQKIGFKPWCDASAYMK